jgi:hypothetical protein
VPKCRSPKGGSRSERQTAPPVSWSTREWPRGSRPPFRGGSRCSPRARRRPGSDPRRPPEPAPATVREAAVPGSTMNRWRSPIGCPAPGQGPRRVRAPPPTPSSACR